MSIKEGKMKIHVLGLGWVAIEDLQSSIEKMQYEIDRVDKQVTAQTFNIGLQDYGFMNESQMRECLNNEKTPKAKKNFHFHLKECDWRYKKCG